MNKVFNYSNYYSNPRNHVFHPYCEEASLTADTLRQEELFKISGKENLIKCDLAINPHIGYDLQDRLSNSCLNYVLCSLAKNINLCPEIQVKLFNKIDLKYFYDSYANGHYIMSETLINLVKNSNLTIKMQTQIFNLENSFLNHNLLYNPNLMPELFRELVLKYWTTKIVEITYLNPQTQTLKENFLLLNNS